MLYSSFKEEASTIIFSQGGGRMSINLDSNYRFSNQTKIVKNRKRKEIALFQLKKKSWMRIKDVALPYLEMLNEKSIAQVISENQKTENFDPTQFVSFVEKMYTSGYIESTKDKGSQAEEKFSEKNKLKEIIRTYGKCIWYSITSQCNLRCPYCYATDSRGQKKRFPDFPLEHSIKILDKFKDNNINEIVITGGEPLLNPHWFEIVKYAKTITDVSLISNGQLINQKIAKRLKSLELKVIAISIDGTTEETHDRIRGKGTFKKALAAVRNLKEAGIKRIHICATTTKLNLHELPQFPFFSDKLGVTFNYSFYMPVGRGNINQQSLCFTCEEYLQFMENVQNLMIKRYQDNKLQTGRETSEKKYYAPPIKNMCGLGTSTLGVEANGDIVPCHLFFGKDLIMGNLLFQPLDEIQANWKRKNLITVDDNPYCAKCDVRYFCAGGCWAHTYATNNSFIGENPYCDIYRAYFQDELWGLGAKENFRFRKNTLA